MADKGYTKMKLLYIKNFLERNSDEDHPVSVDEISDMLENKGISCERKSIYSDVKTLKESGVDIISAIFVCFLCSFGTLSCYCMRMRKFYCV